MFLDYFALVLILIVIVMVFYTFIYIHELPYEAAKHRNHPHADAIWVACWLSLFTLHAMWPIVFLWALTHKGHAEPTTTAAGTPSNDLAVRLAQLEQRLQQLESPRSTPTNS